MARQLRIPQGVVGTIDRDKGVVHVAFDLSAIKASKAFAKLKKAAPEYTDDMIVDLIVGHIAEGVE